MRNAGAATSAGASSAAMTSKKAATKKITAKKPAAKSSHPAASEMVIAAITFLKDKKGSSLQAIKKYIAATYKVDIEKQSTYIKKYLKAAVAKKTIVQTKGTGASGSFRLAAKGESEKEILKKPTIKKSAIQKIRSSNKPVAAKNPAANKTPAPRKILFIACGGKSRLKMTEMAPTGAKPKSPKPKTAATKTRKAKAAKK